MKLMGRKGWKGQSLPCETVDNEIKHKFGKHNDANLNRVTTAMVFERMVGIYCQLAKGRNKGNSKCGAMSIDSQCMN